MSYRDTDRTDQVVSGEQTRAAIVLEMPVYSGGRVSAGVDEAIARASSERARVDEARRRAVLDARRTSNDLRTASQRLRTLSRSLETARTAVAAAKRGLDEGPRDRVELVDARARVFRIRRDMADAAYNRLAALVRLRQLTRTMDRQRLAKLDAHEMVLAAQRVGADRMIRLLPDGYDTVVGAGGNVLSAGQRQRVGLARAVYRLSRLIVLHEPNSNLDDECEQALVELTGFLRSQGCTVLLITHKRQLIAEVDKIAVLQNGGLLLYGSRDEVLTRLGAKGEGEAQSSASTSTPASTS